ncbi:eukaryotic translation initiation factor 2-alpha kinase [Vermiconidia calcicola]|uniref:Eukaryotic translation initiation factor 2-alpha kinase n=1 Tax=Vermiconidia calcicola TaxID=1690605 RepID=A0ACC3NCM3_9PEZI|nr:eukaryotic translation initiation factor 2-alpha kinase [Vermiconidia calcicola]
MAPKPPWNNKATTATPSVRKTNVAEQNAPTNINYEEAQSEEIEALGSIFGDDYEDLEAKGAWSKTTDRSFKLRIKPTLDEGTFITLTVRLTATYPKTAPLLTVDGLQDYHERTQKRINNIVENRPKKLLGEVMIFDISNEIRDALDDAIQAKQQGTLPSLEDQRAKDEEVATELARQAEEAESRRLQAEQDEEDRVLKQMMEEEITRREMRKPSKVATAEPTEGVASNIITFDQPARLQVGSESASFTEVDIISPLSVKRNESVFLAKPRLANSSASVVIAVKLCTISKTREEVMELESLLQAAQKLRHAGLLNIPAYRINRLDTIKSELILCSEYADRGTLRDLLELGSLHVNKARQFAIELLEALDYLHSNGVAHGSLSSRNVALAGGPLVTLKLVDFGLSPVLPAEEAQSSKWRPPESDNTSPATQRKSDIWRFGVVASEMFLGLQIMAQYSSPQLMLGRLELSDSFDDLLRKPFTAEAKKRPSAFDLLPAEFLRTDDPVMDDSLPRESPARASAGFPSPAKRRSRHDSSSLFEPMSRYATDFTELGRLGKGGFGEVVKARNKLDGGVYAVKKIKQAPHLLDQVISEVMVLNRLNHPYVVRYFSTWVEEDASGVVIDDSTTDTGTATETITEEDDSEEPRMDFGYQSTGGLDFVSSAGYPQVEFGDDSENESLEEEDDDESESSEPLPNGTPAVASPEASGGGNIRLRKTRSDSHRAPSTLYIQMEYCERHTLRDLVRKSMSIDDAWRYVRQVTEGLAHIHGHGIIHRDLKPDNVFLEVAGNPKIGDFGLATTAQQHFADRAVAMSGHSGGDMTRSIGTALYVAPEIRTKSNASYNDKVDMYSLGIIFYEMCEPFGTAMERIRALQEIREKDHELPTAYQANGSKAAQGKLISCLISHKPSQRPSSTELLRSDILPLKIEDETIRQALNGLSDPRSPYHQKMMSALFSHEYVNTNRAKAMAWDARATGLNEDASRLRLRGIARHTLETVFRRHGAEEVRRQTIFPRSGYYTNPNVVQLLDASCNLLQLPYDLTLPYARQLGQQSSDVRCTFTFGNAYRDQFTGGPPRVSEEVDFDILDSGAEDDRARNEAEVLKAVDEIVCDMPSFAASATISFHLNHASILDAILDHSRVPIAQQPAAQEMISKLGFHQHTWSKARADLRKFGLPDTTLDDLQQFDFRDVPDKAFARLRTLLEGAANSRLQNKLNIGISALSEVLRYTEHFNIQRKTYITPLGSVNAKFYEDGILFQCVLERKSNRVVVAAGGRYDSLVRAHQTPEMRAKTQGVVGVSIGLDPIISSMMKNSETTTKKAYLKDQKREEPTSKRCDVGITASGSDAVRMAGVKVLASLWASDISAELVTGRAGYDKEYSFVVTIRHEASNTVRVASTRSEAEETDVPFAGLVSHLQQELRELQSTKPRPPALLRQSSSYHQEADRKSSVQVLLARHGSKKSNKYQIVSDAQEQWSRKLDGAKDAPILAVETRDDVLELVQLTRLSDAESWRKAVQSVQLNDRQYVQQIQEMLMAWRKQWAEGDGVREACVFNFRTQHCVYYDLGL